MKKVSTESANFTRYFYSQKSLYEKAFLEL